MKQRMLAEMARIVMKIQNKKKTASNSKTNLAGLVNEGNEILSEVEISCFCSPSLGVAHWISLTKKATKTVKETPTRTEAKTTEMRVTCVQVQTMCPSI